MKKITYERGIQVTDGKGNVSKFHYTLNIVMVVNYIKRIIMVRY